MLILYLPENSNTENAPTTIISETIKNFKKSIKASVVYEDENGNNIAIAFDGSQGPLRMSIINK